MEVGDPTLSPGRFLSGFGDGAKAREKSPGDEVGRIPGRRGNILKWVTRLSI